jgi:hypothetical protein
MPRFAKGSKEAKEWGEKMRAMRGKGMKHIHSDMMMSGKGVRKPLTGRKPIHSDSDIHSNSDTDSDSDMEGGAIMYPPHSIQSTAVLGGAGLGYGLGDGLHIHHHHHHYDMEGGRLSKIGQAFNKAFNPKKNGVDKAVHQVSNALNPNTNGLTNDLKKTFNPALGNKIVNGLKTTAHYAIPAITSALGGAAGDLVGGPIGGVAGSALGAYGGSEINKAIGIQNNTGFGLKRRRRRKH